MTEHYRIRIEVDLSEDESHLKVKSVVASNLEPMASFKVDHRSNIRVSVGSWQIDFHRPTDAVWDFSGFELPVVSPIVEPPILLKENNEGFIRILDTNLEASASESFIFNIGIKTSDGRTVLVDPVIENESGG